MVSRDEDDPNQDLIDSTSDESSSVESETTETRVRRTPRIAILVRHLLEEIETLYDASAIFRRSKLEGIQSEHTIDEPLSLSELFHGTDVFYPHLNSVPTVQWPTEQNLRQKDRIYLSVGERVPQTCLLC